MQKDRQLAAAETQPHKSKSHSRLARQLSHCTCILCGPGANIIEPILLYCNTCYFSMLTFHNRNKLWKITSISSKLIGLPSPKQPSLTDTAATHRALMITHVLFNLRGWVSTGMSLNWTDGKFFLFLFFTVLLGYSSILLPVLPSIRIQTLTRALCTL